MLKTYAVLSALTLAVSTPAMAQGLGDFRVESLQANAFEIQSAQIALSKSRNPQVRSYARDAVRDHHAANVALAGGERSYDRVSDGGNGGVGGLIGAPLAIAGGAVGAATGAAAGAVGGTLNGGPVGAVQGAGAGAARGAAAGSRMGRGTADATGSSTIVQPNAQQQQMLSELAATPAGPRFDRLYVEQQQRSHQMVISKTQAYAQSGPNPALRTYAQQALPVYEKHYRMVQRLPGAM